MLTLTLKTQTSVKGIKVSLLGSYWPDADRETFPADRPVEGIVQQWTSVADSKLKILWPDGYSTEFLSYMLAPAYDFKILADKNGGAVRRRGIAHPTAGGAVGAEEPEVEVRVPYKIGTLDFEQVWTVCRQDISEDTRTAERFKPTMKIPLESIPDIYACYINSAQCMNILLKQMKFINQRLSGIVTARDQTNKHTTIGELLRIKGAVLVYALHQHCDRDELYRDKPSEFDIFGPPALGRFGTGKNRANKLLSLIWQYWEFDESDLDRDNRWRYVDGFEADFNLARMEKMTAGWLLAGDEGMSAYLGQVGNPTVQQQPYKSNPKLCPAIDHVPRKPEPIGKEIKIVVDAICGFTLRIELQRGKADHVQQKHYAEYGHTIAQSVRLVEPWLGTDRVYAADSWFGSVTATETLTDLGMARPLPHSHPHSHLTCRAPVLPPCSRTHVIPTASVQAWTAPLTSRTTRRATLLNTSSTTAARSLALGSCCDPPTRPATPSSRSVTGAAGLCIPSSPATARR